QGELDRGRQQVAAWREEADRLEARRIELAAAIERATDELQAALEGKAAAEDGVLEEQNRLDARRDEIRGLETAIAGHRERRDALRGDRQELRIQQAGLRHDGEHLAAQLREELHVEPPETPAPPLLDLGDLEAELARTKAALERLGPVNLLAVQEHDEQEE